MENQILDIDFNEENGNGKEIIKLLSPTKFIILSILSLGLYEIWWMYKSWKFFKEKDVLDIMPVARAIFTLLFTYQLFEKIQDFAKSNGYASSYSSGLLFVFFVILNILGRLPEPFWLISLLSVVCIIPSLNAFNYAVLHSEEYHGIEREGFNSKQIIILHWYCSWLLLIITIINIIIINKQ